MVIELSKETVEELTAAMSETMKKTILEVFESIFIPQQPKEKEKEWVSTTEAAEICRCTPQTMRLNKDKFTHIKGGTNNQGHLLFKRSELIKEYGA